MRASRGMGCISKKKIKKLNSGGKVKGYELSKEEKDRKKEFESGSPFKNKPSGITDIPKAKSIKPMKKGGTVKDACYKKVKASYKVFPSAYASGAIAKCRKNKGK